MPMRLILIGLAVIVLAAGGLVAYGYSLAPKPKPVQVEIPNDQFPR
jgi:hypothetical protein